MATWQPHLVSPTYSNLECQIQMFFQKYFSVLPDRMKTLNILIYFLLLKINVTFEIQGYEIV